MGSPQMNFVCVKVTSGQWCMHGNFQRLILPIGTSYGHVGIHGKVLQIMDCANLIWCSHPIFFRVSQIPSQPNMINRAL